MTLGNDEAGVRRRRHAAMSRRVGAGAIAAAFGVALGGAATHAAAAPHAGWGSLVAPSAAAGPMRTADVRTPDGDMDALPRLGSLCIKDGSGNDVVVMGRMTDTLYTRLLVTFAGDAPVTVTYGVSADGTNYRTVLDADYRAEESRADDYVISLAVDAMKVYPDVCGG